MFQTRAMWVNEKFLLGALMVARAIAWKASYVMTFVLVCNPLGIGTNWIAHPQNFASLAHSRKLVMVLGELSRSTISGATLVYSWFLLQLLWGRRGGRCWRTYFVPCL
eukprot:scaffold212318_cov31-Attheya_sp.AAC.1